MSKLNNFLQKYGGYLILLLFVATIFVWMQTNNIGTTINFSSDTLGNGPIVPDVSSNADSTEIGTTSLTPAAPYVEATIDMNQVPILGNVAISPGLNPFTFEGKKPEHGFETYTVERSDTPNGIAEKFGIKPETLLGGNSKLSEESNLLQVGTELIILPIDGVLHDVQPGDTVESISELYGIPQEDIIAYAPNNLEFPYRLYPETQIMVPGAVREVFVWDPPTISSTSSGGGYGIRPAVVGTGTFIWPVGSRRITQAYWYGHRGLDIAAGEGSALYAADTGTVVWADWSIYCYGNLIVIDHGNGYLTLYAHLSSINVYPGQVVYQGNVIGATGNTGCSSGPHLHLEIRLGGNPDDPIYYLP